MIASECDCIQLTMKTIFGIILIILVSSATGHSQLKSRRSGDLARLYAHFERQRGTRSAGDDSLASTFIIKLRDNASHDDFQRLLELLCSLDYSHNASLPLDQPLYHWEGVTTGIAVPLNATALHWVRQIHPHSTLALFPARVPNLVPSPIPPR